MAKENRTEPSALEVIDEIREAVAQDRCRAAVVFGITGTSAEGELETVGVMGGDDILSLMVSMMENEPEYRRIVERALRLVWKRKLQKV